MDFSKYVFTKEQPQRKDYVNTYWYTRGVCVAKKVGAETLSLENKLASEAAATQETYFDKEAFETALEEWKHERLNINLMFKQDLFDELGISNHPLRETLFSIAQEYCTSKSHKDCLDEFFEHASKLARLLRIPPNHVLVSSENIFYNKPIHEISLNEVVQELPMGFNVHMAAQNLKREIGLFTYNEIREQSIA